MSAPLCGLDEYGNLQKAEIELPPMPDIPYPMPIGTVLAYYGTTPPAHTLACNGAAISRTAYAELFAVIGTTAGAGDGSTTFNLPDLRGQFVRGTGGSAAALGTAQGDAIREMTGTFQNIAYQIVEISSGNFGIAIEPTGVFKQQTGLGGVAYAYSEQYAAYISQNGEGVIFRASDAVPTAAENRPTNYAMRPCIIFE